VDRVAMAEPADRKARDSDFFARLNKTFETTPASAGAISHPTERRPPVTGLLDFHSFARQDSFCLLALIIMGSKNLERPSAAIAHVMMKTVDIKATTQFYLELGLRKVMETSGMSIVELRGGTHILFFKNSGQFKKVPKAKFDLMVDDVVDFQKALKKKNKKVSAIQKDQVSGHDKFIVTDPDGRQITIFSSHTENRFV
jgi:catechol 2,3-dioxygenase-like lactoylglutathione lyase family enzyme